MTVGFLGKRHPTAVTSRIFTNISEKTCCLTTYFGDIEEINADDEFRVWVSNSVDSEANLGA